MLYLIINSPELANYDLRGFKIYCCWASNS